MSDPYGIGFTCTPGWRGLERRWAHVVARVRDAASLNESRRRAKRTISTVQRDNYKSVINNRCVTVNRLVGALAAFHLARFHPMFLFHHRVNVVVSQTIIISSVCSRWYFRFITTAINVWRRDLFPIVQDKLSEHFARDLSSSLQKEFLQLR